MTDQAREISWSKTDKKVNTKAGLQEAQRRNQIDTENKFGAANHALGPTNAKKLDEDTGSYKHAEVTNDFKKALMQARTAKKMKQKDLAQAIQQPESVVKGYENGQAIPEGNIIAKLNRALGVKLPPVKKNTKKKDEN